MQLEGKKKKAINSDLWLEYKTKSFYLTIYSLEKASQLWRNRNQEPENSACWKITQLENAAGNTWIKLIWLQVQCSFCFRIQSQMGKTHFLQWPGKLETLPWELASWEWAQPGFMQAASQIYRAPVLKWLQHCTMGNAQKITGSEPYPRGRRSINIYYWWMKIFNLKPRCAVWAKSPHCS